jgi:SH3 domain protein
LVGCKVGKIFKRSTSLPRATIKTIIKSTKEYPYHCSEFFPATEKHHSLEAARPLTFDTSSRTLYRKATSRHLNTAVHGTMRGDDHAHWRKFMRYNQTFFLSVLISLMLAAHSQGIVRGEQDAAKTRFVSDFLKINVRDRIDKPFTVVTTVQSDDQVLLLEEKDNYWKILTPDGNEGWIAKHYLISDPPKSSVIKQLREENKNLKSQLSSLAANVSVIHPADKTAEAATCKEIEERLKSADSTIATLQQKLGAVGADDSTIKSRESTEQTPENHVWLIEEYEKRGEQIDALQKSLATKEDRTKFLWFAAGGLVFLIGLLAGKSGSRKKNKLMY